MSKSSKPLTSLGHEQLKSFVSTVLKSDEDFTLDGLTFTQSKVGTGKIVKRHATDVVVVANNTVTSHDTDVAVVADNKVYLYGKSCFDIAAQVQSVDLAYCIVTDIFGLVDLRNFPDNCKSLNDYTRNLNMMSSTNAMIADMREADKNLRDNPDEAKSSQKAVKKPKCNVKCMSFEEKYVRHKTLWYGDVDRTILTCDDAIQVLCGLMDADAIYRDKKMKMPVTVEDWESLMASALRCYANDMAAPRMDVTFKKYGRRCTERFYASDIIQHLENQQCFRFTAYCCKDIVEIKHMGQVIYDGTTTPGMN